MKNFYEVIKNKVIAGQYTMEEIIAELQLAYEKNYITLEQVEELKVLAETSVDPTYTGNKYPTHYDLDQDVRIADHDLSIVELFELVLMSATSTQISKMATRMPEARSISNSYVRLIIAGTRTFSSVPDIMRQEVADKLHAQNRCDLIDVEEFHPPHMDCIYGNKPVVLPEL